MNMQKKPAWLRETWSAVRFRDIFGTRDPRSTRRWRKLRDVMIRREPICRQCGKRASTEVHHIEPVVRRPDLALTQSNLIPVCERCHLDLDRKLMAPRREPRGGQWDGAC